MIHEGLHCRLFFWGLYGFLKKFFHRSLFLLNCAALIKTMRRLPPDTLATCDTGFLLFVFELYQKSGATLIQRPLSVPRALKAITFARY